MRDPPYRRPLTAADLRRWVGGLTPDDWNDSVDQRATPDLTALRTRIRTAIRRMDDWTLEACNPRLPADRRR